MFLMKIAMVLVCPVATVLIINIATKMKICFIPHDNVVKVAVVHSSQQNITAFRFTLS
jgi:hypothetical protein